MEKRLVTLEVDADIVQMLNEYVEIGESDWFFHRKTLRKLFDVLAKELVDKKTFMVAKQKDVFNGGPEETHYKELVTQEKLEYLILESFVKVTDGISYQTLRDYILEVMDQENLAFADFYHYFDQAIKWLRGFGFIDYDPTYNAFNLCDNGKTAFEKVTAGEVDDNQLLEKMHERWLGD